MEKVMLIYPPGKLYQRSEDRAQSNIDDSAASSVHACNDIGYAAAILLENGYDVFLRDYQTERETFETVREDVLRYKPDMILLSTTNATIGYDVEFLKRISEFHKAKTVIKGAIFYRTEKDILKSVDFSGIDCMIGCEIDTAILPVTDCLLRNRRKLSDIPGIIYTDEEGDYCETDFTCWNYDLDNVPFPARQLMNNSLYVRPDTGEPMATIQVSRGCPAGCIYCLTPIISGRKVRFRSVDNVMEELVECYKKFQIRNFFFKADTFTIDEKWAMELCRRIISSELYGKIEFTVNSRADTLSDELLSMLKMAGCFMIAIGFESGSDETLKKINKGTTVAQNLNAAKMVKKSGIPLFGFFMLGFPWEKKEDMQKTLDMVFDINPDFIEIHIAMPYYGTKLYEMCSEYSTITSESWNNDYFSPNTTGSAYVSMDDIQIMKRNCLLKFYLRPSYILKKMTQSIKNPKVIKNYIFYGLKLVKKNIFK